MVDDDLVQQIRSARAKYIAARDAMDELWPKYEATLALTPLPPGSLTREVSPDERALSAEWDRRCEAARVAYEEFVRLTLLGR